MTQPQHRCISMVSDANALQRGTETSPQPINSYSSLSPRTVSRGMHSLPTQNTPRPINECKLFVYDMGHSREHIGFVELMYNASMNYAWLI